MYREGRRMCQRGREKDRLKEGSWILGREKVG